MGWAILCGLLWVAACRDPDPTSESTTGATDVAGSSSGELTSTSDGGVTSTGAPDSTSPTTGASHDTTGADMPPCGCDDGEVCVDRGPTADAPDPGCEAQPPGCDPTDPCSPACAALCGEGNCGPPLFTDVVPGVIYCPDPCPCAADELCIHTDREETPGSDWFCALAPEGCDPGAVCSAACASACPLAPALPVNCDGDADPAWVDCGGPVHGCSLWAENCPAGQKCAANKLACVPVPDPAAGVGQPCQTEGGIDNCEPGSVCFGVDPITEAQVCIPHCSGSGDAPSCPDGTVCSVANGGALTFCSPACDPLAPSCSPGTSCLFVDDEFVCVLVFPGTEGAALDPCEFPNGCDAGLVCIATGHVPGCTGETGCCTPYCDLDAPACLLPESACVSLFPELGVDAPPGFEAIGFCGAA